MSIWATSRLCREAAESRKMDDAVVEFSCALERVQIRKVWRSRGVKCRVPPAPRKVETLPAVGSLRWKVINLLYKQAASVIALQGALGLSRHAVANALCGMQRRRLVIVAERRDGDVYRYQLSAATRAALEKRKERAR
jgi:hypothetical protein